MTVTDEFFTRVTYYFDQTKRSPTVTHILFHFDTLKAVRGEPQAPIVREQLIEKFGSSRLKTIKKTIVGSVLGNTLELDEWSYHIDRP